MTKSNNPHRTMYVWHHISDVGPNYAVIHDDIEFAKDVLWRYMVENFLTGDYADIDTFIADTWMEYQEPDYQPGPDVVLVQSEGLAPCVTQPNYETDHTRECHSCGKVLPYTAMKKQFYGEWDKFIYICQDCQEGKTPPRLRTKFADKYQHLTGKTNWWDE